MFCWPVPPISSPFSVQWRMAGGRNRLLRMHSRLAIVRANWNWRASKEAVGWPAVQVEPANGLQSWFTAEMFVRLRRLKASAMTSTSKRSPRGMRRERRISTWKKLGDVKRLRPRFPVQPAGGATRGTVNVVPSLLRQTLAGPKGTPGVKGDEGGPPTGGRAREAAKSSHVSRAV